MTPTATADLPATRSVERQRRMLQHLKFSVLAYAGSMLLLWGAHATGNADIRIGVAITVYGLLGYSVLYAVAKRTLPSLAGAQRFTFAQVVFSISIVSLTYTMVDVARAISLQMMCLIILFDVRRLPLRRTIVASVLAVILPAIGLWVHWLFAPAGIHLGIDLLFLALGGVSAPVLILVSIENRNLWRVRTTQRDSMSRTLEQLRHLSVHDSLTGTYNRAHTSELLGTLLQRQARSAQPACLAMLDLDYFKRVNDTFGHGIGDLVLKHFARIVTESMRGTVHSLGRWGGEEFLLLMPESDRPTATAALDALRKAVRDYGWTQFAPELTVTVSVGAVEIGAQMSVAQAVELADQGLYKAKAQGRDCTAWTDAGDTVPISPATMRATSAPHIATAVPQVSSERLLDHASFLELADSEPAQGASPRPATRWMDWLLTDNRSLRRKLRLCLVASCIYLSLILGNLLFPLPEELLSHKLTVVFTTLEALGALVPFMLVRSGMTRRLSDPALIVPQMLWAFLVIVLGYALIPVTRGYCLQLLCVVLVFGFVDLRARQAVLVGWAAIVMMIMGYVAMAWSNAPGFDAAWEGLQLIGSIGITGMLTLLSLDFARMRKRVGDDAVELAQASARVQQMMRVDPLTGLCNRQHMQALIEEECQRHARLGKTFCVALIDLDYFKRINDTYGHAVGDEVLMGFARTAAAVWRGTDVIARWGGEEFLVLLPDISSSELGLSGFDRLRAALANTVLSHTQPALRVNFSAGLARHQEQETASHLLERADQALYAAKARGRGNCVVAEDLDSATSPALSAPA